MSGLHASASPAVLRVPLHLCMCCTRSLGLSMSPSMPCGGGEKPGADPRAQLPGHLHLQAPSLLCPLDVALSRLPATPRRLQVSRATFRRPALPGCPVRPSTSLSPCLPGFSPGAARRMHVSDRLLLHFLSAVEVLLNFLFQSEGNFLWGHDGREAARYHDSRWW